MPSDASRAPMVLTNLALTRALLYESTRNPRQLDAAIEDSQRAALRAPGGALMWHWTQQALAESLRMRYERDRRCADLEHAVTAFRASCTDVASHAEHALTCAGRWGSWAAERHAFSEAAEAYGIAVHAARKVFEGQLVRRQTESWLQETQGVHARGAHAMAMAGDARAAVRTLEDGRAVLLSEALERDRADLHHLATLERGELADRYRKAADRLIDATRVGEPAGLAELSRW